MNIKKPAIFQYLNQVTQILPVPVYWLGLNQEYIGINELVIKGTGTISYEHDFSNKTPYDLYPEDMARNIVEHHKEAIRTGKTLVAEESIQDLTTGAIKFFNAIIAPLHDDATDRIIGTIGTSIDITAEKEAAKLKLENIVTKIKLDAQEQAIKIANQAAHDIRSPLASLLMMLKFCADRIPEKDHINMREAVVRIGDIVSHFVDRFNNSSYELFTKMEERQPTLIAALLLELIIEKRFQYQGWPVKFEYDINQTGKAASINIERSSFKRMISNLVNNAVEAFDDKSGTVLIKLTVTDTMVHVIVQDDGKGMLPVYINKIMHKIPFTEGKKDGTGIGLIQVRETLDRNQGYMNIYSNVGQGTLVVLEFPKVSASA